jgi:Cu(I)/Ag(I) efflux system membrane fusion protein
MRLCEMLLSMTLFACGSTSAPATTPIQDPVPMTEGGSKPAPTPAADALADYERIRALLAADEIKGVTEAATALAASATKSSFTAVATSATKLAATTEIEAARLAFGDVSREMVAVLARDPALANGQHVFECPMAKGYRKWIQPSQDMANPYMGQKMLACGGESTWQ